MMCTTVLHGGVFHRTSTPHKSVNKMKEKRKKILDGHPASFGFQIMHQIHAIWTESINAIT